MTRSTFLICFLFAHCANGLIKFNEKGEARACDFPGNDYARYPATEQDCVRNCRLNEECTHYVYTESNDGHCTLKSGPIAVSDAVENNDTKSTCGIKNINLMEQKMPTRDNAVPMKYHWRCEQPNCNMIGRTLQRNSYVVGCCKHGDPVYDHSTKDYYCSDRSPLSACDKYQPWVAEGALGYGFVSVSGVQVGLFGDCCSCYGLTFLNDTIERKSMIVQVINVGPFQQRQLFQLLIPGGKVLNVNSCQQRWDSPHDWNSFIANDSSRKECDTLPEPLRKGCLFRFDFLELVDNLEMDYVKVECPKELVAISGCAA